jgi:hypothetical protein
MHAVVRTYSGKGAKGLIDIIEKNTVEVERLIRSVKGFVSYSLVRTTRGGFSVSVYQDKAGTDESIRVARDWIIAIALQVHRTGFPIAAIQAAAHHLFERVVVGDFGRVELDTQNDHPAVEQLLLLLRCRRFPG